MKIIETIKNFYEIITYEEKGQGDNNHIVMMDLLKWGSMK